ncbi:hypothetical protein V6N13_029141 [Hibiscus sabdariffa]
MKSRWAILTIEAREVLKLGKKIGVKIVGDENEIVKELVSLELCLSSGVENTDMKFVWAMFRYKARRFCLARYRDVASVARELSLPVGGFLSSLLRCFSMVLGDEFLGILQAVVQGMGIGCRGILCSPNGSIRAMVLGLVLFTGSSFADLFALKVAVKMLLVAGWEEWIRKPSFHHVDRVSNLLAINLAMEGASRAVMVKAWR